MTRLRYLTALLLAFMLAIGAGPASAQSLGNFRNLLVGGDVGADPFAGGTANVTGINTTGTYFADNFYAFANNAGASVTLSRQTGASDVAIGFGASVRVQRANANANLQPIVYGQILENALAIQLQGQTVVMSAVCQLGANFSGTASQLTLQMVSGTTADQGLATRISGWAGAATTTAGPFTLPTTGFARIGAGLPGSGGTSTAGGGTTIPAVAVASFVVPTNAQELAFEATYTPVGTAGANDWFECSHFQVEAIVAPTGSSPANTVQATPPERRPLSVERLLAARYVYGVTDGAATARFGLGQALTTTTAHIIVCAPVPMRVAPTASITVTASFAASVAAGTVNNFTSIAGVASSGQGNCAAFLGTIAAANLVAGNAVELMGQATAGILLLSSRL